MLKSLVVRKIVACSPKILKHCAMEGGELTASSGSPFQHLWDPGLGISSLRPQFVLLCSKGITEVLNVVILCCMGPFPPASTMVSVALPNIIVAINHLELPLPLHHT